MDVFCMSFLSTVAFRYPTQPTPVSSCPSGYTSYTGACYRVISTAMDFDGAQATCQVDGANLASINSAFEQMSIEIATKNIVGPIWIGLKHQVCESYYTEKSNLPLLGISNISC
jgi:hypothetical protein